ncbi:MAG: hypothetical protein ACYTFQ_26395 [Planctomycetota bacterium]|jgi:hypothetical protein
MEYKLAAIDLNTRKAWRDHVEMANNANYLGPFGGFPGVHEVHATPFAMSWIVESVCPGLEHYPIGGIGENRYIVSTAANRPNLIAAMKAHNDA